MSTITLRDWFAHSGFVLDVARREVNQQLDAYAATAAGYLAEHGGTDTTVYVSGSIARGEPAIRSTGLGNYALASSVDLVAVTDGPIGADHPARHLASALHRSHPRMHTAPYLIPRRDLPRVAGRFGVDLHHAIGFPLAGLPIDEFAPPRIGARERLEGLVHQLSVAEGATGPGRVKTVLEALRAVTPGSTDPQYYTHLATSRGAQRLLDRDKIENLIRAREYALDLALNPQLAYNYVIAAAARLLGVVTTDSQHRGLIAALHHNTRPNMHLLNGFQLAMLAVTVLIHGPAVHRRAAAAALHVIASSLDPDSLPTARQAATALARLSPVDLTNGGSHADKALSAYLRALRADYYGWLVRHNTGVHPVDEYAQPAVLSAYVAG